jgi:hypothetical protein
MKNPDNKKSRKTDNDSDQIMSDYKFHPIKLSPQKTHLPTGMFFGNRLNYYLSVILFHYLCHFLF